jgi:serine protease Do
MFSKEPQPSRKRRENSGRLMKTLHSACGGMTLMRKTLSLAGTFALILLTLAQGACLQNRPPPTIHSRLPPANCSEDDSQIFLIDLEACKSLAHQGNASAAFAVGRRYQFSGSGALLGGDPRTAEEYYKLAADAGHAKAQYQLYQLYSTGVGVPKNEGRAARYLEMAANTGYPAAESSLGLNMKTTSPEKAAEWLLRAAMHGECIAQCKIAEIYKEGLGVERNLTQALFWVNVATAQSFTQPAGFGCGCSGLQAELEKLLPPQVRAQAQEASSNWRPGEQVTQFQAPDIPQPASTKAPPIRPMPSPSMVAARPQVEEKPEKKPPPAPSELTPVPDRAKQDRVIKWPKWTKLEDLNPNPFFSVALLHNPSKVQLDPEELFRQMSTTVWTVISEKRNWQKGEHPGSLGSAVAISRDMLLTNCHVVKDSQTIQLLQRSSRITAKVISADEKTDRCVLLASTELTDFVDRCRGFDDLHVGEKVYTIGSPRGLEQTLGDGIISGLRTVESMRFIQTTAPISPGSSGGGLFDQAGNLIGLTTFLFRGGQNLNFAIAVSDFLDIR